MIIILASLALAAPPACDLSADVEQGDGLCIEPVRVLRYEQQGDELAQCTEHLTRSEAREDLLADTVDTLAGAKVPTVHRVTWEGVALGASAVVLGGLAVRLAGQVP